MGVRFTKDVEAERIANAAQLRQKDTWEYLITNSLVEAVHYARKRGWKENKVQVREIRDDQLLQYAVEPFEVDCGCSGILKYSFFFGDSDD